MVAVMDAMMPRVTEIDQAVIAQPTIGKNYRFRIGMATNHRL